MAPKQLLGGMGHIGISTHQRLLALFGNIVPTTQTILQPLSLDTSKPIENGIPKTKIQRKHAWRAMLAYWLLGLTNNYGYVVMLSAAHDILHNLETKEESTTLSTNSTRDPTVRDCNQMSTGAILLADIIPCLIIKFIAPFLPFYIHVRVSACVILSSLGFLFVAFAESQTLAILGVVVTSISSGLGEVSFLQFSSYYSKNVVSTWSSGTGGAGVLGAISYAGLSLLGLRTALLIMLFIPLLMCIAFWIVRPVPRSDNKQCIFEQMKDDSETNDYLTELVTKLKFLPGLAKFMLPLGSVYLFEYFINQGMFELIFFEAEFLDHGNQYKWLQVLYQVGVFVSRSSVNLFHIKNIWLLSLLQLINVFLFSFEAIYAYMPSIWIVFVLTLWEGLLGGGAYVNTFYKISRNVPEDRKQFSMSVTSLADTIGITLAGILALPAHNAICSLSKPQRL